MGYNYGKERKKMEKEFSEMADICRGNQNKKSEYGKFELSSGEKVELILTDKIIPMPEDKIEEIRKMLHDEFKSNRCYCSHTQSSGFLQFSDDGTGDKAKSLLLKKFSRAISITQGEISEWGRYSWIEDIDAPEIAAWVKSLSERDIELITLMMEGMSQTEIAEMWGCSDAAVSKRKKRFKRELANILHKMGKFL